VREVGALAGVAGALRLAHAPLLRRVDPDFAGFRTAVCSGDRSSTIDPERLHALMATMHGAGHAVVAAA
ncbi:MAG: (5-formylfuran-3-yl)methyl phosphate synthase, partial [Caldimonas sp.]